MSEPHQFDYIFALGLIFAFADAWNIGANDVANSFATSVSSRSLTLKRAMALASVMEFSGAVLVGGRVADTIRNKIIKVHAFEDQPYVLMLAMVCALVGSSTWLTIATSNGMPVSTTHSIVGGIIGTGVATLGAKGVNWGWNDNGVSQIIASWFVSPAIAGGFAAILFLLTKHTVLKHEDSLKRGLMVLPLYFGFTSGILTMVIVWKGAVTLNLDNWTTGQVVGCILGVSFGVIVACILFFVPWVYRILFMEDWALKWYHIFLGPALWLRGPVPDVPEGVQVEIIQDYYRGIATREDLEAANIHPAAIADMENHKRELDIMYTGEIAVYDPERAYELRSPTNGAQSIVSAENPEPSPWYRPRNLRRKFVDAFFHGVNKDVVLEQTTRRSKLAGDIQDMHARAAHFDNKTEHLYSFLQVLTAATASFAHGSNDTANAIGPLATIYFVWSEGKISTSTPVAIWVLAYGGAAIVAGLWTYGYNIMRNLGNRLTLQSPSRGFSMELGAAITVVMATRLSLPISTTQCIVGATMFVALCNGDMKALNWRMVGWCYFGWVVTLPVAGLLGGCFMAIIINAPKWTRPPN